MGQREALQNRATSTKPSESLRIKKSNRETEIGRRQEAVLAEGVAWKGIESYLHLSVSILTMNAPWPEET